jgi:hypothetical protein
MKFLDGFMTITTGNINYPITAALAYTAAGQLLDNAAWRRRGRYFAHESLKHFTVHHLLFGEGKCPGDKSPKGYWAVDLGYNVEESLPSLAMYALLADDGDVLQQVLSSMRTHMEFMLPDGGWDNSWGTRNFKWSWWGSRTSDGCQPAYVLLSGHDSRFLEVAWRNFTLLERCTHDGLLYGGPHYYRHGDLPCSYHTIMHAKALATVLDRFPGGVQPASRVTLPRDEAYELRHYEEIGTSLVAVGDWRATVTDYDWEYCPGGHASGGALSLLYHGRLGPILVGSMTEYQRIEPTNQQSHRDHNTMPLTPRIECRVGDAVYTNLSDYRAAVHREQTPDGVAIAVQGRLCDMKHRNPDAGEIAFWLSYRFTRTVVRVAARVASPAGAAPRLIVPVVCPADESLAWQDPQTVCFAKPGGRLRVHTQAAVGFIRPECPRVFNLVPGFECLPLAVSLPPGAAEVVVEVDVKLTAR